MDTHLQLRNGPDWFRISEVQKNHPSTQPQTNFLIVLNYQTTQGIQWSAFSQMISDVEPL